MEPRQIKIVAAASALVLALVVFLVSRHGSTDDARDATVTLNPVRTPEAGPAAAVSSAHPLSDSEATAARRAFLLQNAAGLATIPRRGKELRVDVAVKTVASQPPCSAGDIEAIAEDVAASKRSRLLLTAESLAGDSFKPSVRSVTLHELKRGGLTAHFDLPAVDRPTTLGFFLCKDSSGKGSCRHKTVKSINAILQTYTVNAASSRHRFDASDKIYFFGFGVLTKDKVMIFPDVRATKARYEALTRFLTTQGESAKAAAAAVARVKDINDKLETLPPEVHGNDLTMPLAYGHPETCGKTVSHH